LCVNFNKNLVEIKAQAEINKYSYLVGRTDIFPSTKDRKY